MPMIYSAACYCNSCGMKICQELRAVATQEQLDSYSSESNYDSDEYPKYMSDDEESDNPQHCDSGEECLEAEVLPSGRKIGALLSTALTTDAVKYVGEAIARGGEVAEFWKEQFLEYEFPFIRPQWHCLDEFTTQYIETLLWSTTDNADEQGGEPLDDNYDYSDMADECVKQIVEDCQAFQEENKTDLEGESLSQCGHDFALTRNGHGAGFWDGDYEKSKGDRLTKSSKVYGSFDLYVGDDGKIYS